MGNNESLNKYGLLSIGINPEWSDFSTLDLTGVPSAAAAGLALNKTPSSMWQVNPRTDIAFRTTRVEVTAGDAASTYTVTIDGNASGGSTGNAAPAAIVLDLITEIQGTPAVDALVTASVDADDVSGATLLLQGKAVADYTMDAAVAAGAGTVALTGEPAGCTTTLFGTPGGSLATDEPAYDGWSKVPDGEFVVDQSGTMQRFDVAGLGRVYAQVHTLVAVAGDGGSLTLDVAVVRLSRATLAGHT